ncbi:titin-like isoform X3 [Lineus longissimus]|uniref:titin-like isoform X3 n=1 Tax=Lineus longissimus TaxID=88925 RepID=UPI00315DD487
MIDTMNGNEYQSKDEETLKTLLETCFDLDERLKIRRALRKIRSDVIAAPKVAPELPKAPSSIQKALSLRDDRLNRRCSMTRRRISKGDLDIRREGGRSSDDRSEDSDDQRPVTKLNGGQTGQQNDLKVPRTVRVIDTNGKTNGSSLGTRKSSQGSLRPSNVENGILDSLAPRKSSVPGRSASLSDNKPIRRVSEPQAKVTFSPSGDLVNGDSSSDRKTNGFNRPRRSITFGDPNAHSLLMRKDPDKEDRNLDEIDNLLDLNTLLRESRDFEERRRIRARIRQIKDDMHEKVLQDRNMYFEFEEKERASAPKSPPSTSTSSVSHMTDDEINNALSAVKQQIDKELEKPLQQSSQEAQESHPTSPPKRSVRQAPLVLVQQVTRDTNTSDDRIGTEPVEFTDEPPIRVQKHINTESYNLDSIPKSDSVKDAKRDTVAERVSLPEKQTLSDKRRKTSGSGPPSGRQKDTVSALVLMSVPDRKISQVELEQAFDDVLDDFSYEAEAIKSNKTVRLSTSSITSNDLLSFSDNQNENTVNSQSSDSVSKESAVAMEPVSLDTIAQETNPKTLVDQESVSTKHTFTDRMSEVDAPATKVEHQNQEQDEVFSASKRITGEDDQKKDAAGDSVGKKEKKHKHKHRHHSKDGEGEGEERKEKKKHKHKHKHHDEEGKEKKKSRKELPPDSDLAGIEDVAVLEQMLEETTDFDRRRDIRHAVRVLKRKARDLALERREKKEKEQPKRKELEVQEQEDGTVIVEAKEVGPKEEKTTTVLTKASRTASKSQLVTKDTTVVTKRKTSDGDEYTEVDNILTSKKLTTRGSMYMDTEFVRSKHLKDSKGKEFIEEEVISSRVEDSISKDEARENLVTTTTHLVLDKDAPKDFTVDDAPKVDFFLENPEVKSEAPDVSPLVETSPQVVMAEEVPVMEEMKEAPVMEDAKELETPKPEEYLFEITEPLFNQQGKVGASTTMECKINTDCPKVNIEWFRDDTLLDNGDDFYQTFDGSTARLLISETQLNDSGMYRCLVRSGEMMELESGARLTVIEEAPRKPVVLEHLNDKSANDGDKVTLECSVEECENLTIKWYKDDVIIKNDADFKQTFKGNKAKLVISEIFPEDGGIYSCVITNENGEARSACSLAISKEEESEPATLVAPDFIEQLKDVSCKDGEKVAYSCKVVGDPKPIVTWYKNDRLIRNSSDFFQTYDGFTAKLLIEDVYPADMGVFKCLAENKAGQAESTAHLIVLDACTKRRPSQVQPVVPQFIEGLKDASIEDTHPLVLQCKVTGDPRPTIKWYKDGKILKHDQDFQQMFVGETAKLDVFEIFPDDEGVYKCVAKNSVGECSTECYLTVTGPHKDEEKSTSDVKEIDALKEKESLKKADFIEDVSELERAEVKDEKNAIEVKPVKDVPKTAQDNSSESLVIGEVKSVKIPEKVIVDTVTVDPKGIEAVKPIQKSASPVDTNTFREKDLVFSKPVETKDMSIAPEKSVANLEPFEEPKKTIMRCQSEIVTPKAKLQSISRSPYTMNRPVLKANTEPFTLEPSAKTAVPESSPTDVKQINVDIGFGSKSVVTAPTTTELDLKKKDNEVSVQSVQMPEKVNIPQRSFSLKVLPQPELERPNPFRQKPASFRSPERSLNRDGALSPPGEAKPAMGLKRTSSKVGDLRSRFENMNQSPSSSPLKPLHPVGRSHSVVVKPTQDLSLPGWPDKDKKDAQNKIATFLMNRTGSMKSPGEPRPTLTSNMSAVDYETITDEVKLQKLLTDTQDFDERKKIRQRIRDIRDKQKQELDAQRKHKDSQDVQRRQKLAEEDKQRRLEQYQKIAYDPNSVRKDEPRVNVDVVRDMAMVNEASKQRTAENVRDMAGPSSSTHSSQSERLKQLRQKDAEEAKQKKIQSTSEMAKRETHSKTETLETQDGSTKTVTTTTKEHGPDGSTVVTRNQKTTTSMTGMGGTVYGAKPDTADVIAEKLSKNAPKTSGQVTVKMQSWNSKDGVITRDEKTSQWGGTRSIKKPLGAIASLGLARPQGARGAMAAFKQMDNTANPGGAKPKPNFLGAPAGPAKGVNVQRSPSAIKQMLMGWCASMTRGYEGVNVTNFSSSWADGLAFCALIHHFHPEAFEFSELKAKHRRKNFTLAFDTAEKFADIAPLLDVEDMVRMKNPDWKCVFTYVQSFYRKFRNHECAIHRPAQPPPAQ